MLQSMRASAKYIFWFVGITFVGGFLLAESSGLLGRGTGITPGTAVAVVNGREIRYVDWQQQAQQQIQAAQQQSGRSLSQDETQEIENDVFDQIVTNILLQQEEQRRGIDVTPDEIRDYARLAPPSWLAQAPELQTEGQFDPAKYQRLLASPAARQQGLLAQLEAYYRVEIPKQKLFEQVAAGTYVTDEELWRAWRDSHDSAQVSFVAWHAPQNVTPDQSISDDSLRAYFNAHLRDFEHPGRAVLSVVRIVRRITPADSQAVLAHAQQLRQQILGGAKFEDIAKSESADSASAVNGGDLGKIMKGQTVPQFETAAFALKPGQISQPVLSPFGYHLIRLDARNGDTLSLHHILLRIQASDSSTARTDREADQLSKLAANSENGAKLEAAAKQLGLPVEHAMAVEGQPATIAGQVVPSVSAWAFSGAKVGETSDLFDSENGYVLARLDSITPGGKPNFDKQKAEVREALTRQRALEAQLPKAKQLAQAAASSSLQQAAQAQGTAVTTSGMFVRGSFVPGLGQLTKAVGAAFGIPQGAVSQPVLDDDQITVLHVDRRVMADSAQWAAQKDIQRQQRLSQLRTQKVQLFLQDLRKTAKIDDRRKQIAAQTHGTAE